MTKLERIEEMEKQLKALKEDVDKENNIFTPGKMHDKLRNLRTYFTFDVKDDGLLYYGGSNDEFTVNLGKLQKLIDDIAYIRFSSFKYVFMTVNR